MFGDFCHNNKEITHFDNPEIENGTPIVRWSEYFPYFQFGIYNNGIIIQHRYDDEKNASFYEEIPICKFLQGEQIRLFEYTPTKYKYSKEESLERAKSCLNKKPEMGVSSIFGDDFVFWCLVGDAMESFFLNSKMGRHFKYKYREKLFLVYHHAIALEEDIIIHFTDISSNKTTIAISPFNVLQNPVEVKYKNDSYENRMIARNRALWAWANPSKIKPYNFLSNNCEHLATWCKTGKKSSAQVLTGFVDLTIGILGLATQKGIPLVAMRLKKYFY